MPVTFAQATNGKNALDYLVKQDRENKFIFASSTRIKIASNIRFAKEALSDYIESHNTLVQKYGSPVLDEKGNDTGEMKVDPKGPNFEIYTKEEKTLLDGHTDITFKKLTEEELFGSGEPKTQNQIDVEAVEILIDVGILNT